MFKLFSYEAAFMDVSIFVFQTKYHHHAMSLCICYTVFTSSCMITSKTISASCNVDGLTCDKTLINIDYDHIPLQTVLKPAESVIVKVPLKTGGRNVAYLMEQVIRYRNH